MTTTEITSGYKIDGTILSLAVGNTIQFNLSNPNTWLAVQTFGNDISIGGAVFNVTALTTSLTTLTINSPTNTTIYSGMIIIEGY